MGKIEQNKASKRRRLLESLNASIIRRGISETSIDEICEQAGIAKGTFYLYYRNKEALVRDLTLQRSRQLLQEAFDGTAVSSASSDNFVDHVIAMAEFMINRMELDHDLLKVVRRDFTWPITAEDFLDSDDPLINSIHRAVQEYSQKSGQDSGVVFLKLFSLLNMIATSAYSSIIDGFPTDIERLKPCLFEIIRSSL